MRTIRRTAAFKRDYKREKRGRFARDLDAELASVLTELAADRELARRHHDHQLSGQWKDHRDCHIRPNLVLIYRKSDATPVLETLSDNTHHPEKKAWRDFHATGHVA